MAQLPHPAKSESSQFLTHNKKSRAKVGLEEVKDELMKALAYNTVSKHLIRKSLKPTTEDGIKTVSGKFNPHKELYISF